MTSTATRFDEIKRMTILLQPSSLSGITDADEALAGYNLLLGLGRSEDQMRLGGPLSEDWIEATMSTAQQFITKHGLEFKALLGESAELRDLFYDAYTDGGMAPEFREDALRYARSMSRCYDWLTSGQGALSAADVAERVRDAREFAERNKML